MKTNIQDKALDAIFQKLLPPEEYGEDSNVEELYNRIMDLETELEKIKVSSHESIQQGADSGQLQQHNVSGWQPDRQAILAAAFKHVDDNYDNEMLNEDKKLLRTLFRAGALWALSQVACR